MKKLADTYFLDEQKGLSVVKPKGFSEWIVIDRKAALMHGPDNFANCERFVNEAKELDESIGM